MIYNIPLDPPLLPQICPCIRPVFLLYRIQGQKRYRWQGGHRTEQSTHCALVQTVCPELNICERVTDVRAGIYNSSNLLPSVLSCRGTRLQLPLNISSADRHSNVQFVKLVLLWRFGLSLRKFRPDGISSLSVFKRILIYHQQCELGFSEIAGISRPAEEIQVLPEKFYPV